MKFLLLSALFSVAVVQAAPAQYIVLFKQAESLVTSMDHQAYQNHLQSTNQKSVTQLHEWMGARGASAPVADLWLASGAITTLEAADAARLAKEAWVRGVYVSKFRQFVNPGNLIVANTLEETTSSPGSLWGLAKIGVDKIRREFPNVTGAGVRVAVLDTGIQSRHPQLKGVKIQFKDFVAKLPNAYDDHGHGTHVTGTIAGRDVGIAPQASIWMGKIFSAGGGGNDADILMGMQWAFNPDGNPATNDYPRIISNSWGAALSGSDLNDIAEFAPFHQAVLGWIKGGIIPVFAAGNSGASPNGMPGGFPEVISVGAFDSAGKLADFSSRGPNLWRMDNLLLTVMKPDISAPGVAISSSFPGNKYASWEGTSMATPHVAGTLALAVQLNPKLNLGSAKALLLKASEKKVDNGFGYGTLDAYEVVKMASTRALQ